MADLAEQGRARKPSLRGEKYILITFTQRAHSMTPSKRDLFWDTSSKTSLHSKITGTRYSEAELLIANAFFKIDPTFE
jgi:hypothetical protein